MTPESLEREPRYSDPENLANVQPSSEGQPPKGPEEELALEALTNQIDEQSPSEGTDKKKTEVSIYSTSTKKGRVLLIPEAVKSKKGGGGVPRGICEKCACNKIVKLRDCSKGY